MAIMPAGRRMSSACLLALASHSQYRSIKSAVHRCYFIQVRQIGELSGECINSHISALELRYLVCTLPLLALLGYLAGRLTRLVHVPSPQPYHHGLQRAHVYVIYMQRSDPPIGASELRYLVCTLPLLAIHVYTAGRQTGLVHVSSPHSYHYGLQRAHINVIFMQRSDPPIGVSELR